MVFKPADPAALLRVLTKHDRLEDAASLALAYLSSWQRPRLAQHRSAGAWLPHAVLQNLQV